MHPRIAIDFVRLFGNRPCIAVVDILSGGLRYCGPAESQAAAQLEPGTCFAHGDSADEAIANAVEVAQEFRDHGYKPIDCGLLGS